VTNVGITRSRSPNTRAFVVFRRESTNNRGQQVREPSKKILDKGAKIENDESPFIFVRFQADLGTEIYVTLSLNAQRSEYRISSANDDDVIECTDLHERKNVGSALKTKK